MNLEDLPTELLIAIIEIIYVQQAAAYLPVRREFGVLHTLSRVSRRMRALVLPFMRQSLVFASATEFMSTLAKYATDTMQSQVADVKKVSVGRRLPTVYTRLPEDSTVSGLGETILVGSPTPPVNFIPTLPFSNLISFQSPRVLCTPSVITALSNCPRLQDLIIACEIWTGWPRLELLTELRSARVYLYQEIFLHPPPTPVPQDILFQNISTLVLHNKFTQAGQAAQCFAHLLPRIHFPHLRVLALHYIVQNPVNLFQFVHRHPTLLEVNVSALGAAWVRLEALLTLIDGTGTWIKPDHPQYSQVAVHQVISNFRRNHQPVPPDLLHPLIRVADFAFARTPLNPLAERWRKPIGSTFPRYRCTALSLVFMDLRAVPGPLQGTLQSFHECLTALAPQIPDVQQLRICVLINRMVTEVTTLEMMKKMRDLLQGNFQRLNKLALHWASPPWRTWGHLNDEDGIFRQRGPVTALYVPYLDFSRPLNVPLKDLIEVRTKQPWETGFGIGKLTVSDDLGKVLGILDDLRATIRTLSNLDEDAALDEDSDSLLTEAWEARNGKLMAWIVREWFAKIFPNLAEFEWWPALSDGEEGQGARWNWKIARDQNGRCNMVTGKLRWERPAVFALVGEELSRAYDS